MVVDTKMIKNQGQKAGRRAPYIGLLKGRYKGVGALASALKFDGGTLPPCFWVKRRDDFFINYRQPASS